MYHINTIQKIFRFENLNKQIHIIYWYVLIIYYLVLHINFMDNRIKITFLILVLIQGLHSIEEYFGRLWKVFPPARLLCNLVSENPESGFLIINILIFIFGLLCWLITVHKNYLFCPGAGLALDNCGNY